MLPQTEQDRLVDLLEACHAFRDPDYWPEITARLPDDIRSNVDTRSTLRIFLVRLVRVCANYPGGLRALAEAVRFFEGKALTMEAVDRFLAEAQARPAAQGEGRPGSAPPQSEPAGPTPAEHRAGSVDSSGPSGPTFVSIGRRRRWWLVTAGLAVVVAAIAYLAGRGGCESQSPGTSTDATRSADAGEGAVRNAGQVGHHGDGAGILVMPETEPSPEPDAGSEQYRPALSALAGGRFRMGSPESEHGRDDDEGPRQWVTLSPFWMCRTEITQAQWKAVMGQEPSDCDYGCGDELPVQNVSWSDVVDYMNELSRLEGLEPCYERSGTVVRWKDECDGYRLPTEAEWEYAARAGSESAYSFGDDAGQLGEYAWYEENAWKVDRKARAVATRKPNAWGLYDMHGNAWEWVWDEYGAYEAGPRSDPRGPASAAEPGTAHTDPDSPGRVLRGGSFEYLARLLRSGFRNRSRPGLRDRYRVQGARCARSAPQH
ncbi:SUMF1/EgtB/PvdO family nonheme iron enzyme [Haliangium sp.]|uniref:SUMF1/EgtB/PvdO family nonheme iron enzyme n=1 Tax=Haliangium sp. TaxID=2663208 RepID=UPI003D0EB466